MADDAARITVVLADDHAVVRTGLRMVLDAQPDIEVVAEADDVDEAVALTVSMRPAVLVLDLGMPAPGGVSSLDALPRLASDAPASRVVILTMEDDPEYARQALAAGATAYVLKEAAHAELVAAIRRAADGEPYLNPRLGALLAATTPAPADGPPDDLTEREAQILRLIALGHTNAEIGRMLHLSVRTIEARRAHVQQKLGRATRPELVRYALDRGLLDEPA